MIAWLVNIVRGMCMGIADAIPGVSGGTIALILGIYERFIGSFSAIGAGFVRALFTRAFWSRVRAGLTRPESLGDAPNDRHAGTLLFLGSLVLGIATALVIGARFIPDLLARYPSPMNGFFLGLVLASIAIPLKMLKKRGLPQVIALLTAAVATFFFVALPLDQSQNATGTIVVTLPQPTAEPLVVTPHREAVVFLTQRHGGQDKKREIAFLPDHAITVPAGAREFEVPVVARLAGQLANLAPGELVAVQGLPEGTTVTQSAPTSGGADPALWFIFLAGVVAISAMVLPGISGSFVLLMLGLYNYIFFNLRTFVYDQDLSAFAVLAVFGVAVITGLLSFCRFVSWLLRRFHDTTLAALVGIMVGSLRVLWPFTSTDAQGEVHAALPSAFDGVVIATLVAIALGVAIVFTLEWVGRAKAPKAA